MKKGIADHKKGTSWSGIEIEVTEDIDGVNTPLNLTGASIIANFKSGNTIIFSFKTNDNTILIPTPTNGKLYFKERIMNVPASNYCFDIIATFPDGTIIPIVEDFLSWNIHL